MTVRWWWAHYETGSPQKHFAWCNICDIAIAFWSDASLPSSARKKIDGHRAEFGHEELVPA